MALRLVPVNCSNCSWFVASLLRLFVLFESCYGTRAPAWESNSVSRCMRCGPHKHSFFKRANYWTLLKYKKTQRKSDGNTGDWTESIPHVKRSWFNNIRHYYSSFDMTDMFKAKTYKCSNLYRHIQRPIGNTPAYIARVAPQEQQHEHSQTQLQVHARVCWFILQIK